MKQSNEDRMYDIQIEQCCKLSCYIREHHDLANDELTNRWKSAFFLIAKRMGFNKEGRRYLWEQLAEGNWEHLHQTKEENMWSRAKWLDNFASDLWYCSDRMSFDRLTRLHWQYRQCLYMF